MLAASLEKVTAAYQAIYLRSFITHLDNYERIDYNTFKGDM